MDRSIRGTSDPQGGGFARADAERYSQASGARTEAVVGAVAGQSDSRPSGGTAAGGAVRRHRQAQRLPDDCRAASAFASGISASRRPRLRIGPACEQQELPVLRCRLARARDERSQQPELRGSSRDVAPTGRRLHALLPVETVHGQTGHTALPSAWTTPATTRMGATSLMCCSPAPRLKGQAVPGTDSTLRRRPCQARQSFGRAGGRVLPPVHSAQSRTCSARAPSRESCCNEHAIFTVR